MRTDVALVTLAAACFLLAGIVLAHTGHIIATAVDKAARNRAVGGLL